MAVQVNVDPHVLRAARRFAAVAGDTATRVEALDLTPRRRGLLVPHLESNLEELTQLLAFLRTSRDLH
jgi:hypothetical protein